MPNFYPALTDPCAHPGADANPDLSWAGPATGAHEVIINAPDPVTSLAEPSPQQVDRRG